MYKLIKSFLKVNLVFILYFFSLEVMSADLPVKVNYQGWSLLSKDIASCKVGQHNLPDPIDINFLALALNFSKQDKYALPITQNEIEAALKKATISYQIQGLDNNSCLVSISKQRNDLKTEAGSPITKDSNDVIDTKNTAIMKVECRIDKEDLNLVAKKFDTISSNSLNLANDLDATHVNAVSEDPLASMMTKYCK